MSDLFDFGIVRDSPGPRVTIESSFVGTEADRYWMERDIREWAIAELTKVRPIRLTVVI